MIKNEELYDFQAEPNTTGPDTEPTPSAEPESRFPSKFLYQTIVSICCLILLLAVSSSQSPWLQWVGARIHSAVNTSMEDTFGRLSQSGFVRRLITNAGNLVRLEEITKTLSNQELGNPEATMFQRTVWPVQGSIIKGYGWRYNSANKTREFNSGVEITALPDAPVLAIADGTVSKIIHDPEDGWEIVLKHDEGWTSNYHYLGQVKVNVGQNVKAGEAIALIGRPNQKRGPVLFLEIKDYDQPVDPMSVLAS